MTEIVEGLGPRSRERIPGLREEGRFFWIDLCADDAAPGTTPGMRPRHGS